MTAAEDGLSDDDLMRRVQEGHQRAYAVLVQRHLGRVVAVAQRVVGSRAEAEEVAQDVFLTVWQKPHLWQPGRASFGTWVYRVAMNRALDVVRRVRPQPLPDDYDAPDGALGVVEQRMEQQQWQSVAKAVAELPERQRAALALCYQADLPDVEAAAALGTTVKAYESLLVRARRSLRQLLQEKRPDDAA